MNSKIERRNYALGVLNGTFIRVSYSILHGETILPAFLWNLTSSNVLIGLSASLRSLGTVLPQIVTANLLEDRPRKKPVYVMMTWVRTFTLALLAALVYWARPDRLHLILPLFFLLFTIHTLAAGIANIPFSDIVGKITIPFQRGSFFSLRNLLGGSLAALAGVVVVKPVLARYVFPRNYGLLFFFSLIFLTFALLAFSLIKEPVHPVRTSRRRFRQYLRAGFTLVKTDRNYSLLLLTELAYGLCAMATPFYIIFARNILKVPEATVGTFLAASMLGAVISNLLWRRLSISGGSRTVIQVTAGLIMLMPVIALTSTRFNLTIPVFFAILFFLGGASTSGYWVGHQSYLLDIAPGPDRPTYVAFLNTLTLPIIFFPPLGGLVVNLVSFDFLFGLALAFGIIAFLLTLMLKRETLDQENAYE